MSENESPIDRLLADVRAKLHARRTALLDRVGRIEAALENYRLAVETDLAQEFAREHLLKQPALARFSASQAARLLMGEVQLLPELAPEESQRAAEPEEEAVTERAALSAAPGPTSSPASPSFAALARVAQNKKIVVIGGLSGRDRSSALPTELSTQLEWIDTERDGAHAIGNLPQRLKQGRVAAVLILERVVQHRHTEPVLAAARDAGVPFAFAGQGGKASLWRALEQIELSLQQAQTRGDHG